MRLLTLAAGIATGYVLGTRAGRDKYEQIVDNAKQFKANPSAGQALAALQTLVKPAGASATPAPTATLAVEEPVPAVVADVPTQAASAAKRPGRPRTTSAGPGVTPA